MTRDQFPDSGAAQPLGDVTPVQQSAAVKAVMAALAQHGINAVTTVPEDAIKESVVLVAFQVRSASMMHSQQLLAQAFAGMLDGQTPETIGPIAWWFAEDERYDGSDNDSAVFVPQGRQTAYQEFIHETNAKFAAAQEQRTSPPEGSGV